MNRKFYRLAPNELRVTDITEHPTREGKVDCCAEMDTYSRKSLDWRTPADVFEEQIRSRQQPSVASTS